MKCNVCGMEVQDRPKPDAEGKCKICGQDMERLEEDEDEA